MFFHELRCQFYNKENIFDNDTLKCLFFIAGNVYYIYLYNNSSYSRILIGSRL